MGVIKNIACTLPPVKEQTHIAAFLDQETAKIDGLVDEQRRLMELLKEKRRTVISYAVTKGINPSVPMKPSGIEWLGDVPAHWEIGRVKNYFRTSSGGTPNTAQQELYYTNEEDGIPWVRTTDLQNEVLRSVDIFITQQALADTACAILPPNTVMVAMYGGDPQEFRGFALADDRAPLVFINGADSKAAQMFTLAHELAHLWLEQSALSDVSAGESAGETSGNSIETWCNQVAAELLVPMDSFLDRASADRDEPARLRNLDGPNSGDRDFFRTMASRVGKRFARALVGSTLEGRKLYRDAFRMLGIAKTSTFNQFGRSLNFTV